MKKKTIFIIKAMVAVLLLSIILIIGFVGYFYYSFSAADVAAQREGAEFGGGTDQKGCVDEAVRRFAAFKENNFFTRLEQMHIGQFTSGCLTVSKPTKDFCQNIPAPSKYNWPQEWELKKCEEAGLDINGSCHRIFAAVAQECSKKKT